MTMALFSESLDKLTAAGVVLSGATADDSEYITSAQEADVHLFI